MSNYQCYYRDAPGRDSGYGHSLITKDCLNGTWLPNNFNGGFTNYSYLMQVYGERREEEQYRESNIAYEPDITIYNQTK